MVLPEDGKSKSFLSAPMSQITTEQHVKSVVSFYVLLGYVPTYASPLSPWTWMHSL